MCHVVSGLSDRSASGAENSPATEGIWGSGSGCEARPMGPAPAGGDVARRTGDGGPGGAGPRARSIALGGTDTAAGGIRAVRRSRSRVICPYIARIERLATEDCGCDEQPARADQCNTPRPHRYRRTTSRFSATGRSPALSARSGIRLLSCSVQHGTEHELGVDTVTQLRTVKPEDLLGPLNEFEL